MPWINENSNNYKFGFQDGYDKAIKEYNDAFAKGYLSGHEEGKQVGYKDGIKACNEKSGLILDGYGMTIIKDNQICRIKNME